MKTTKVLSLMGEKLHGQFQNFLLAPSVKISEVREAITD